jgi:hypothetical protein
MKFLWLMRKTETTIEISLLEQHVSHVRTQNELQNHYVQRAKKLAEPSVVLFSSAVQLAGSTAAPARLESQPEGATREDTGKNVSTARCHLGGRCCSNSLVASACALLQEVHRVTNAQLNMNVLLLCIIIFKLIRSNHELISSNYKLKMPGMHYWGIDVLDLQVLDMCVIAKDIEVAALL